MKKFTIVLLFAFNLLLSGLQGESLKVCVTVPDLADLVKIIGGDQVEVTTFVKGQEDPHALVAKPSDILKLSKADALVLLGMGMEIGWVPALVDRSRNRNIRDGQTGYIDVSKVIEPIHDSEKSIITRAMGDVHPEGNPHYMVDPVNGLKAARYLSESFSKLRPSLKNVFSNNLKSFEKTWAKRAFGAKVAERYPLDKLIEIQSVGKLTDLLKQTGELKLLKGWFGKMEEIKGVQFAADHSQWPYFAARFNVNIDHFLEPKPGVPPSAKYLKSFVEFLNAEEIPGLLSSSYGVARNLNFVQKNSKVSLLPTAHQVGSRKGVHTYLDMIDYNIGLLCDCCKNI